MRNIYSCIDIGSHSTKLVIAEKFEDKFIVLSRQLVKSKGIKKGVIVNEEEALVSVEKAVIQAEEDLNITIKEILCLIPCDNVNFSMVNGEINIEGVVDKKEIDQVLKAAVDGKFADDQILVSLSPVFYQIDDSDPKKDVKGLSGNVLSVKAVAATVLKSDVKKFFDLLSTLDIKVVDIGFKLVGDYQVAKDLELDEDIAAVINMGYDTTEVGIFNKGILIKAEKLDFGSKLIDKDIAQTYNFEKKKARYLKETFAVSNTRHADVNDIIKIPDKNSLEVTINQLKISEIVENRVLEILKLAKKQINLLTNREIRYIIVTGGISELAGFSYALENVYGRRASVLNMDKMGVRSNSYSSCIGYIEYFDAKLENRDKSYSMVRETEMENMARKIKKTSTDGGLGNFLSYLTGNKED